jgi:hypothetical protein
LKEIKINFIITLPKLILTVILPIVLFLGILISVICVRPLGQITPVTPWDMFYSIVQIFYLIGGVILAITAILALNQLKISKNDTRIRVKRDAATETAKQIELYAEKIIPLHNEFVRYCINGTVEDCTFNSEVQQWISKCSSKQEGLYSKMIYLLNKLEAFAIYFIHGIGNEKLAFAPISNTYMSLVQQLYPMLCIQRQISENMYTNLMELYNQWSARIQQTDAINKALQANKAAAICPTPKKINPIGMD